MYTLSKSTYLRGRQCTKALWLSKNRRDLMAPIDPQQQAIFDTGRDVGRLARQLFPGGTDCSLESPLDFGPSIAATQEAIANGATVIYEAAFLHDDVLAALDILVRTPEGWKAFEVKSSASVKDYQIHDMALQAHVIEGSGLPLADVSIVHVNTAYVRQGDIDVHELFCIASVRAAVEAERRDIPRRIEALKSVLANVNDPEVAIGPQCQEPFTCDFKGHCWAHIHAERSVFKLARGGKRSWDLYARGILNMEDIPEDERLSATQQMQVDGWKHGTTVIDRPRVAEFVQSLQYPLYHFDFETFSAAVPIYDATRPYQQIPFQYSVQIQAAPGADPVQRAFLGDGMSDPREALVRQLLDDLGGSGDILVYNATFERSRLQDLARDFPQFAEPIAHVTTRLKDLMPLFQKGWYYLPAMNGKYSIKDVLPAMVPELDYGSLTVQEGGTASLLYGQLSMGQYTGDVAQLRTDLLAYCGMDTLAMVRILGVLVETGGS